MDRALDEVIGERQRGNQRSRAPRRQNNWSRDGPRKSGRDDRQNIEDDWIHDRYEEDTETRRPARAPRDRAYRASPDRERELLPIAKLRVDNLHYELTEDDLEDLFNRIAPVKTLSLTYDRAGRSTGTAFVTYTSISAARNAVREFDGANAKGQPIRLTLLPSAPANPTMGNNRGGNGRPRNPFDDAVPPGRSLLDRAEPPHGSRSRGVARDRSRSRSPGPRRSDTRKPAPENIDRYVPGGGGERRPRHDHSRSPIRGGGRGGRRDGGGARSARGGANRREDRDDSKRKVVGGRPRMTQEELDKDMDEYWGNKQDHQETAASGETNGLSTTMIQAAEPAGDIDIDMIE